MPAVAILRERIIASYLGLLLADALSMPVHWVYDPSQIRKQFGTIETFYDPPARHPSSLMSISNVNGAGRAYNSATGKQQSVIGDVILHGMAKYWNGDPSTHYHALLKAGENTLNSRCARLLARTMVQKKGYSEKDFLDAYVDFMTTPGKTGNETYAESFHRIFFSNYAKGVPPAQCSGNDNHNIDSVGGLVMLPPVSIYSSVASGNDDSVVRRRTVDQLLLTHKSKRLAGYAAAYGSLLGKVLQLPETAAVEDFRSLVASAAEEVGLGHAIRLAGKHRKPGVEEDLKVIGPELGSACYIDGSLASVFYLSYKYADRPADALVSNTNVGGENCHRGSALGALLGVWKGNSAWPKKWIDGLAESGEIQKEAEAFADLVLASGEMRKGEEVAVTAAGAVRS